MLDIAQDLGIIVLVIALGAAGGQPQFSKAFRRYGITLLGIIQGLRKDKKWKSAILAPIGIILSMGYGETSSLSKVFPHDWQRRIIYGLLLSIPFALFGLFLPVIILPIGWSIRLPYSHKVMGFEILWEDVICRYLPLGYCITLI